MNDSAIRELLASYEVALDAANRSLRIAQALADGYRSGVRPPDAILDAYFVAVERDQAQLAALREKVQQFKSSFNGE